MKKRLLTGLLLSLSICFSAMAQKGHEGFGFKEVRNIPTSSVKDQQSTGTCWCFATISFLETELMRMGKKEFDLSEMFVTRNAFIEKGKKYFRFHGKTNFSEGGQAHDVTMLIKRYGIVPEDIYLGHNYGSSYHIHQEMVEELKGILDGLNKNKNNVISTAWERAFTGFVDSYLGEIPETFTYEGKEYTPKSFSNELGLNMDDYVELTSYSCYPFYEEVELEIPDNWTHDRYYNLPIDELMDVMNNALENGYSVAWDGDVSEKGFSHRRGIAVLPTNSKTERVNSEMSKWDSSTPAEKMMMMFAEPVPELKVTDEKRMVTFNNRKTTDDHLMHMTGLYKDKFGTHFYKIKNSWAANSNDFGGYLMMSDSFVRMKTVAIMVHKDAIPKKLRKKLGIK